VLRAEASTIPVCAFEPMHPSYLGNSAGLPAAALAITAPQQAAINSLFILCYLSIEHIKKLLFMFV
jgi:hypothetical protein